MEWKRTWKKTKVMKISRQPSSVEIMIHQKQPENAEYFNYLGSIIIKDARRTRELKSRNTMAKRAFNKTTALYGSKLDSDLRKKLVEGYIWSIALYGAGTWTLRKVDQKYLESLEIWCWRRTEKIKLQDRVKNKEAVQKRKEKRNTRIKYIIYKIYNNWSHLA
jgi:hypothetical protein